MKVTEHIENARQPLFSYEILPPRRGHSADKLMQIVNELLPLQPPYIDVTSHSARMLTKKCADGSSRQIVRKKRPGTISICGVIQNRYHIDTVAHLLCQGFSREETEDALIDLNFLGIQNVLALRGDTLAYEKDLAPDRSLNNYAADLVTQIHKLRQGEYLEGGQPGDIIDMCIGVAGYPEKHYESPDIETDIQFLKEKIEAGADYIVTQMFFENASFFAFVERVRAAGIQVPVIPGIKILRNLRQLERLPETFHIHIPEELKGEMLSAPEYGSEIGIRWAHRQVEGLLASGVKNIHFYIMNEVESVKKTLKKFTI
ncbi:MAG TPA: methylenetetrahydrofolate reductase [NAD(P)H] [Candidatus Marinimicrobia bacterium]|nr:methylenetetrahydrofolate reductase [NAD(P)H] [Candidatus Neomarinimicrobiota bacterium]